MCASPFSEAGRLDGAVRQEHRNKVMCLVGGVAGSVAALKGSLAVFTAWAQLGT